MSLSRGIGTLLGTPLQGQAMLDLVAKHDIHIETKVACLHVSLKAMLLTSVLDTH